MKKVYIIRVIKKEGAFGMMCGDDGIPFAVCLERTFDDDLEPRVVIPEGEHKCVRSRYNKGGYDTFEIQVPGHERVLFHKGNVEEDSMGCVLIGEGFEPFNGKPGIAQSAHGFEEFWSKYKGEQEILLVTANVTPHLVA